MHIDVGTGCGGVDSYCAADGDSTVLRIADDRDTHKLLAKQSSDPSTVQTLFLVLDRRVDCL